jgi:hypothetical protein
VAAPRSSCSWRSSPRSSVRPSRWLLIGLCVTFCRPPPAKVPRFLFDQSQVFSLVVSFIFYVYKQKKMSKLSTDFSYKIDFGAKNVVF